MNRIAFHRNWIFPASVLSSVYWIFETSIGILSGDRGSFTDHLVPGDFHDLRVRVVTVILLFVVFFLRNRIGRLREEPGTVKTPTQEESKGIIESAVVLESAADAVIIVDDQLKMIYWNGAAERIFGYTPSEVLGKDIHFLFDPKVDQGKGGERSELFQDQEQTVESVRNMESMAIKKDEAWFPASLSLSSFTMNDQWYRAVFVRDITEQKRREYHQRNESDEWNITFDAIKDMVLLLDHKSRIVRANQSVVRFAERSIEELIGHVSDRFFPETEPASTLSLFEQVQSSKSHEEKEIYLGDKGAWVLNSLDPIFNSQGEIIGAVQIIRDITQIKEMHQSLLEAKEEWEETFNVISDAMTIQDKDFNILRSNRAAQKMLGLPGGSLKARRCFEGLHGTDSPIAACPSCDTLRTGVPATVESYEPHLGAFLEIQAFPRFDERQQVSGLVHIVRNISDRKQAEKEKESLQAQLLQAQKMESIGSLAGGVAHDFNNILSAILGYGELALETLSEDHPALDHMQMILQAGEKAEALVRQLLAFSRKQDMEMRIVDLNSIVQEFGKMLTRVIGEGVELELHTKSPIESIMADSGQIEQVLMNLAVNARDAMSEGGRLTIETSQINLDKKGASKLSEDAPAGSYVSLLVSDTGEGMNQEMTQKIFEPFFTTKASGKGTGLGLAMTYGIVKQHHGFITVHSEPGKGTTFQIYFPASESHEKRIIESSKTNLKEGSETILVVDDESSIHKLIKAILSPLGYQVLQASCAKDALELCERLEGDIDLLLTDIVMPEINGKELSNLIHQRFPAVETIYMSGYPTHIISQHHLKESGIFFIQKPFSATILTSTLRQVLDNKAQRLQEA